MGSRTPRVMRTLFTWRLLSEGSEAMLMGWLLLLRLPDPFWSAGMDLFGSTVELVSMAGLAWAVQGQICVTLQQLSRWPTHHRQRSYRTCIQGLGSLQHNWPLHEVLHALKR